MDQIFRRFLQNSYIEATRLAENSDVLEVVGLPPLPPAVYICEFALPYLRKRADGVVEWAGGPIWCALHFPEDYLRSTDPKLFLKIASVAAPAGIVHPNIWGSTICLGSQFAPGTPIRALLWELYEILAYRNFSVLEPNVLNIEAARLLRQHRDLLERRIPPPLLRRRKLRIQVMS
jgi:hypothetical protein